MGAFIDTEREGSTGFATYPMPNHYSSDLAPASDLLPVVLRRRIDISETAVSVPDSSHSRLRLIARLSQSGKPLAKQ